MIKEISLDNVIYFTNCLVTPLKGVVAQAQTSRIKEIVLSIFSKVTSFFHSFNSHSTEVNLLPVAMISCLTLAGILVISIIRKYEKNTVMPSTPMSL